ncbi:1512_t:CDS:2 [Racocetra fulgida]|uniref:1512_t:CDS:1 n=1 Tax=Racocetra fulgida TaxID=60492 RepID=A0A9N9A495_9GLOM|nr:1512_t:CDS:2 [Racocetra fulgida]
MPTATNALTKTTEPITPPTIAPVLDGDVDDVGMGGEVPVVPFPFGLFGPL